MVTTLAVIEDQALIRSALMTLLSMEEDVEVVGGAGTLAEGVELLRRRRPQVCLLDIELPDGDGIDAVERLRAAAPGLKIVVVTTFTRPGFLVRALQTGVEGFIGKDRDVRDLAAVIRDVVAGERVIDSQLARESIALGANPLTARERDVLTLIQQGLSTRAIAERLCVAPGTARNYLSSAIWKMGATSGVAAAVEATRRGWLFARER